MDSRMEKVNPVMLDVEIEELEQKIAPDGGENVLPLASININLWHH